jgi:hypothetical protein
VDRRERALGAGLETPWSTTNAQYRDNVLDVPASARGARRAAVPARHSAPYTGGEAAAWWQQVAAVADIVREDYFSDKRIHALGPIVGNRTIRAEHRARSAASSRSESREPPRRHARLPVNTSNGGRAGLEPRRRGSRS